MGAQSFLTRGQGLLNIDHLPYTVNSLVIMQQRGLVCEEVIIVPSIQD